MSEKPAILLFPGAFGLPEFYDAVVNPIAAQGHSIRALHLPSVGYGRAAPPSMQDDADFIASEVSHLADKVKDVVLIAHSYGAIPATQSTKAWEKRRCRGRGRRAYMTCFVPPLGASGASALADAPSKEHMVELRLDDDNGWLCHADISTSAATCFCDLPKGEGEAWVKKFPRHFAATFPSELTHAGYRDIPVSCLVCEDDLCIPASTQKAAITIMGRESGWKVDVASINADHCPFISKPQVVTDWVLNVAAKV